jgi:hypothetical protein
LENILASFIVASLLRGGAQMRSLDTNRIPVLAAAIAASIVSIVHAVPVIDGTREAEYGSALAVQTVQTGFGDNESELDAMYSNITSGRLSLFFAGNLQSNYNKLVVFLDTKNGGQSSILASSPIDDKYAGLTFDTGFTPDYAIIMNRGDGDNNYYVDFAELPTAGGGFGGYAGRITVPGPSSGQPQIGSGFLVDGLSGMPAIELGYNDANIAGVSGGDQAADPVAAAAVSTGTEFAMDLSALGITGNFKVMAFVNGSGHDFASNQFLPGLPAPQGNLGGDGTGTYTGNLAGINLNNYAGDQFTSINFSGVTNDWNLATGGDWNTAANWSSNVVPDGPTAQAVLAGPAGAGTRTVNISSPVTVQQVTFNNATASYAVTGAGITLNASPLLPSLVVAAGSHTISAPVTFQNVARVEVATGSTLSLAGAVGAAGLDLFLRGGGTLNMPAIDVNSVTVNAGVLKLAGSTHTLVRGVTIDAGGQLDLGSNALIVDYDETFSPLADIQAAIADSRLVGVNSSASNRAIGYADTAVYTSLTSYDGAPLDATALVFVSTLKGDADLNKSVDFNDLLSLAQNYDASGSGKVWTQGDSTGDGIVNFDDLLSLAQNYGLTAFADGTVQVDAQLHDAFASHWAAALSMVPEPASLATLLLSGLVLGRRRK